MNTGFLGPAVATVLTVYGIETNNRRWMFGRLPVRLQQYLPFTVLKLCKATLEHKCLLVHRCNSTYRLRY